MSLTFYFSIISSVLISLIFCRNKTKSSIYSLVILLMIVNFYFYFEKNLLKCNYTNANNLCKSESDLIKTKYDLDLGDDYYTGYTISNDLKLKQIFKKDINNLSISVQIYSLYFAKNSIIKYPLGVGLNNYIILRNIL